MKECKICINFDQCTPIERRMNINNNCEYFEDIYSDNQADGGWKEFSYKKYTDNGLDYGEPSEWDIYLEEENKRKYK
jgi:hypothetical protein